MNIFLQRKNNIDMFISVDLDKAVDYAKRVSLYNEGAVSALESGSEPFEKIVYEWKAMISGAHEMPAFGVSLNNETLKALKKGLWVEFAFDCVYGSNGMPYEKLLIHVEKNNQGFNIIRYNSDYGYNGRCFYYDLVDKNMSNFHNLIANL